MTGKESPGGSLLRPVQWSTGRRGGIGAPPFTSVLVSLPPPAPLPFKGKPPVAETQFFHRGPSLRLNHKVSLQGDLCQLGQPVPLSEFR